MSTDGSQSDEAFSDEGDDDSDDDFVSDDDDFKGKKTKKSNLSRIKKGPAAMAKAPRIATPQSQRPAPVTFALELGNAFFMHCADVMSHNRRKRVRRWHLPQRSASRKWRSWRKNLQSGPRE